MGGLVGSIGAVSGFFTLAAFAIAAVVLFHRARLAEESRRIQSLPEGERGAALDAVLDRLKIDAAGLTREQRYRLAERQLASAQRRDLYRFALTLVAIIVGGALWWQSQRTASAASPPRAVLTPAERESVAYHVDAAQWLENNARPRQALDHYRAALRFDAGDTAVQRRVDELQQHVSTLPP